MRKPVPLRPGIGCALASALLFGASTPLAKALLGAGTDPWLLAGLLYLASGLGLALVYLVRGARQKSVSEAQLQPRDLPWLVLVVFFGGVAGPVLLMVGLQSTEASAASLLLNLEGLATMAIAWIAFRENVDRRLLIGAGAILLGAVLLSWTGQGADFGLGSLAIAAACIAWGVDNNLTRKLSGSDPVQIAMVKGTIAGVVNLTWALLQGASIPEAPILLGAGVIGFLGYGVSLVLFVLALRYLGTARTGAYYSLAPFAGAVLAIALGEEVTLQLVGAGLLMGVGLYLHLAERHDHEHHHAALEHEHRHRHDAHHQHVHAEGDPSGEPHSHWHRHAPMTHRHAHYPDLHHRHRHNRAATD